MLGDEFLGTEFSSESEKKNCIEFTPFIII